MADYQVIYVSRVPCPMVAGHSHLNLVGTGQAEKSNRTWRTEELRQAMVAGDRFYIQAADGRRAELRCVLCRGCLEGHTLESGDHLAPGL